MNEPTTAEQRRAKHNAQNRAWFQANRERKYAATRAWRAANLKHDQARRLAYLLRTHHGLTPETWAAMWESQDGLCYLCGRSLETVRVHIDHHHSCCPQTYSCRRCRRGLTCNQCNVCIGMAGDDPERLRRIADNLDAANARITAQSPPDDEPLTLF